MTSTVDAATPFEEAFKALVAYLRAAVKANEVVSIPEDIERPFRSISKPSDSGLLRPLLKLFDGREQHHLFQLTPKSFCGILFIVLHFSYSTAQDKLLYIFKSATESYGNVAAVQKALEKCGIDIPNKSTIESSRQAISDRLLHSLLRKLVSGGVEKQQRWTTTLLISSLIRKNKAARDRLTSYSECKHLISFVQDLDDYVGRILICNLIRELLFHGAKSSLFWSPESQPQIAMNFPIAQHGSPAWLADLRRFFSDTDSSIAFNDGRQRLFAITELVRTRGSIDQLSLNIAAVVADELVLIMPQLQDTLQLVSIPFRPVSAMIISYFSEPADNDCSIRVSFPTDEGFEVCNGVKAALSGLLMTFESADDAHEAQQMLQDVQQDPWQGHMNGPKNYNQDVAWESKKSIAILNLWPPGKTIRSDRSKLDQATSGSEASDTQELSPLQHRSQTLNTAVNVHCPAQAEFRSDSETASEIDRLEAVPNTRSLTDRLKLSQGSQKHISNYNTFNKRVGDVAAGDMPSQRSTEAGAVSNRDYKEGTTVKTAHPPNKHVQGAKIAGPRNLSHSKLSSILRESTEERKPPKQAKPAPTASTAASKQAVPIPRPTRSSPFKISSVPSSATSTKRVDGGPMARLVGSHSQQKETASQLRSSLNEGLKRKSAASKASKKAATDNTDWEQDLQDGHEFDFPGDQESDEAPSKKRRKTGRKPAVKTPTQKTSNHNILPKKKPQVQKSRGIKMNKDERPSQAPEQTVAATRTRRTAPKSSRYVDVSSSDTNQAMDTMPTYQSKSPVDTEEAVSKRPKKRTGHSGAATPTAAISSSNSVIKSAKQRQKQPEIDTKSKKTASDASVEPAARMKTSESTYARGSQNAQSTEGLTADSDTTKAPQNLCVEQPDDDSVDGEEAQDSHPIDESTRSNAVPADISFGMLLATQLQSLDRSADENKEDLPPQPRTPFGNENQFIDTINHHKKRSTFPQVDKSPTVKGCVKTTGKSTQLCAVRPSVSPTEENSWSNKKPAMSVVEPEFSGRPGVYRVRKARGNPSEQPIFIDSDNLKVFKDSGKKEISKKSKVAEPPNDPVSTIVSAIKARNQIEKHRVAQSSQDADDGKKPALAAKETAFEGEDFGDQQNHDDETSEPLTVTNALSPTKLAVQTKQKDALRSDGTKRATSSKKMPSHQIPHAQKLRAREDSVSEEQSEKSSVIRFDKDGPLYKDVHAPRASMTVASPMAPPPETSRHHQAKRQEGLVTSEATPSRRLEAFIFTTQNQSSYGSEDGDEGLTVEADTESRHLMQKNASIDANESHPNNGQSRPATRSASDQNHSASVNRGLSIEGSDVNESAEPPCAAEQEEEASESPSADGEDVSEYEEGSKISNEHSETDGFAIEDSESHLEGPRPPDLDDTPQHSSNAASKTTTGPVKNHTRISDGISKMVDSIHPGAAEGITTKPFKYGKHESAKPCEIIDSNRSTKADMKGKADEIDASSTKVHKVMPPPPLPEQRASSQKKQPQNTSHPNDNADIPRFANPICDIPTGSEVTQSSVSQLAAHSGPRRVPRRSKTTTVETAIPVSATPEPMHVKLAEPTMQENTTIWHQSNGSHLSERIGASTLVNAEQPQYEREMTDTSDGSVSPSPRRMSRQKAGLWRAATQGPHRDLMGHVMQIADDVLLRLGDEEDAVRAKMSEYKQGAAKLTTQAFNTWNESFTYEINQLRTSLTKARQSLTPGLNDIGKSGKGVELKWSKLSNLKSVEEAWNKRPSGLLQSLDALEVEEDGQHKCES